MLHNTSTVQQREVSPGHSYKLLLSSYFRFSKYTKKDSVHLELHPEVRLLSECKRWTAGLASRQHRLPSNLVKCQNLLSQPFSSICFQCVLTYRLQFVAVLGGRPGWDVAWGLKALVIGIFSKFRQRRSTSRLFVWGRISIL